MRERKIYGEYLVGINGVNKKIVRMSSKKNKNNYIKNNKENENKK
jgi:hypothetical protein